ncbi:MAG: protein BatD [Chthoniobacterales bacterium]|nr:protein BatD [Chthoniobacterales bacterium]
MSQETGSMQVPMSFSFRHGVMLAAAVYLAFASASRAEVVTSLSSQVGQVGVPLQLQYQFINVDPPQDMPRSLMVPGLEIRLTGTSRRVEMVNFQTASAMIYAYTVIPNQPGNFTIPGFAVQAGGKQVRTDSVNLRVTGPGGSMPPAPSLPARPPQTGNPPSNLSPPSLPAQPQAPAPGRSAPRGPDGEPAAYFGEIVMGAKSAYVGEVVPVELRFYFRADSQFDNLQRPSFGGDGFTAAPLTEPEQTEQYIDDVPYNIVTFRSAITPVKSGEIEIPAAMMEGRMMSAGAPSGMDPFFDQFFQNIPMPGFGRAENIQARTNPRKIEVLPLPKEGRPENFSGAIGQFTIDASATPRTVKAGEPVTLALAVEGRGNFDAISPPALTGTDGWRTYAPKESFKGADAIGYGGTKTFEVSMVARTDQTSTPGAEFSYFDPLKKKYVTLKTEPVAVTAAGGGAKAGESSDAKTAAQTPSREDEALPAAQGAGVPDIAAPATTLSRHAPSFEPWLTRPWFRIVNIAVLAALLISVPWLVWIRRRAMKSERTAGLEAALRSARGNLQKAATRPEFYGAAAQFVQSQLALWDDKPAGLIDAAEALARRVPDPEIRRELESVLARCDELKYGGGGSNALEAHEKRRVVELLEKFSSNHV